MAMNPHKHHLKDMLVVKDETKTPVLDYIRTRFKTSTDNVIRMKEIKEKYTVTEIIEALHHLDIDVEKFSISAPAYVEENDLKWVKKNINGLLEYNGGLVFYFYRMK
jgi:hypothetical protein